MRALFIPTLSLAACSRADADKSAAAVVDTAAKSADDREAFASDTDATSFGVFDLGSREYGADPLIGRLTARGWQSDSVLSDGDYARVLKRFHPGETLTGIDSTGKTVRVVIDSLPNDVGGESVGSIAAHLASPARRDIGPVLFWTRSLNPTPVRPVAQQITPVIATRARRAADSIFALALTERDAEDSLATIRLRDLTAFTVPGADSLLVVYAAADMLRPGWNEPDDRGSFFAVLYRPTLATRYGQFGHPEWSPNSTMVRVIKPVVYFTLPGDSRVLMFADYQGPWESNAFGLLDLATGRPLARF